MSYGPALSPWHFSGKTDLIHYQSLQVKLATLCPPERRPIILLCSRYFVPYIHIGKFVEQQFNGDSKKLPIMCIGVTSGVGRLLFGYIADKPWVNRILLQQVLCQSCNHIHVNQTIVESRRGIIEGRMKISYSLLSIQHSLRQKFYYRFRSSVSAC